MINPIDYKSGFGGSYGVQADRMDSSALGWDHYESPERHPSQKGNLHLWVWFGLCGTWQWVGVGRIF